MFECTAGPECSRYKADKDRDEEEQIPDQTMLDEDITVSDSESGHCLTGREVTG